MPETYEGYTNYETWLVALTINNTSNECIAAATLAAKKGDEELRSFVEDTFIPKYDTYPSFVKDLIVSALDEVNWDELVKDYTNEDP